MNPQIFLGDAFFHELVNFCHTKEFSHLLLIADDHTYDFLGREVETILNSSGFDVRTAIFHESHPIPNEKSIVEILLQTDSLVQVYLSVGSGTLTDITRFISDKMQRPFFSLPTAPSVDGFSSPVAAMVLNGIKTTIPAHPPLAIFADPQRLAQAPQPMIAAGFGDLIGKVTALADWRLGYLIWNEKYDERIANREHKILEKCVGLAAQIGQRDPQGIAELMNALIASGNCMADFGSSQPASGSEHHLSHYLELKHLREEQPPILHGAKVGLNTFEIARLYEKLRHLNQSEAAKLLHASPLPLRASEEQRIREIYPQTAESILASQRPFLELSNETFSQLKHRILIHWDEIQKIAAGVPSKYELTTLLRSAGCAINPEEVGLTSSEVKEALCNAHYLRPRFTVCKLMKILYPGSF